MEKLKIIRETWIASKQDVHYFSRADFDSLANTIEALWKVAEAARQVAWFVDSLDDDIDPKDKDQKEYVEQKKAFFDALTALEGK